MLFSSNDGVNWVKRFSDSDARFSSLTYGKGSFLAVGNVILQSGQISVAKITGMVTRSDNNQPLNGVSVDALQSGSVAKSTQTSPDGNFILADIAPGVYDVRTTLKDFLAPSQTVTVQVGASTVVNFTMQPKPTAPPVQPTTQAPDQNLVNQGLVQGNLKAFVSGAFISPATVDRGKKTIVLTHGWRDSPSSWPTSMAQAFTDGVINTNILAWDWNQEAANPIFPNVYWQTPLQGEILGKALVDALGPNYGQPIHFIGHSLGTLVNAAAINYLHGDSISQPSSLIDPNNTLVQDTIFDDAEFQLLNGVPVRLTSLSTAGPTSIPRHAAWIDNYYSLVGSYHSEAFNVALCNIQFWQALISDPACANTISRSGMNAVLGADCLWDVATAWHAYPCVWYRGTTSPQSTCEFGNMWSFERNGIQTPYTIGDAYVQKPTEECDFEKQASGEVVLACQDEKLRFFGQQIWLATVQTIQGQVQAVNSVAASVIATAVNFVNADIVNPIQGATTWALQLILQKPSGQTPMTKAGVRPLSATSPSVYAWVPLSIPTNAIGMSFQYCLTGLATNDYFTVGITNRQLLSVASRFVQNGVTNFTGVLDVSSWAGQSVQLFLALNSTNEGTGSITFNSIQFYALAAPALTVTLSGVNVVLSWPISASGFTLESASDPYATNAWTAMTNAPNLAGFQYTVTNAVAQSSRFYRLRH